MIVSDVSTRRIYESGLSAVTSDTVCFPAKLVHGHIRNLVQKGVDRIFMPSVTTVPSENQEDKPVYVRGGKGYPLVVGNSDHPQKQWGIPYDAPLFHWYTKEDQERQLKEYMKARFQIPEEETAIAVAAGNRAQEVFRRELKERGRKILNEVKREGKFAVVLASAPIRMIRWSIMNFRKFSPAWESLC